MNVINSCEYKVGDYIKIYFYHSQNSYIFKIIGFDSSIEGNTIFIGKMIHHDIKNFKVSIVNNHIGDEYLLEYFDKVELLTPDEVMVECL